MSHWDATQLKNAFHDAEHTLRLCQTVDDPQVAPSNISVALKKQPAVRLFHDSNVLGSNAEPTWACYNDNGRTTRYLIRKRDLGSPEPNIDSVTVELERCYREGQGLNNVALSNYVFLTLADNDALDELADRIANF